VGDLPRETPICLIYFYTRQKKKKERKKEKKKEKKKETID
jgi:hypothetical protein